MELDSLRREYKFDELSRKSISKSPFKQFETWLNEAVKSKTFEPNAMSVATVGPDGFPQSRMVLLKYFDENGFIFFTSYKSEKGKAIAANPKVALSFFWPELERQVRITGFAEKTSEEQSETYFKLRPVTSQIAAIVSKQSVEIPDRQYLENQFYDLQDKLLGKPPKRPKSWGGFIVKPTKIEFWQGRESRLHDRILYERTGDEWIIKRLSP